MYVFLCGHFWQTQYRCCSEVALRVLFWYLLHCRRTLWTYGSSNSNSSGGVSDGGGGAATLFCVFFTVRKHEQMVVVVIVAVATEVVIMVVAIIIKVNKLKRRWELILCQGFSTLLSLTHVTFSAALGDKKLIIPISEKRNLRLASKRWSWDLSADQFALESWLLYNTLRMGSNVLLFQLTKEGWSFIFILQLMDCFILASHNLLGHSSSKNTVFRPAELEGPFKIWN